MKNYDPIDAWKDVAGLFGIEAAPRFVVRAAPSGHAHLTLVRLPSRSGWIWRVLTPKRTDTNLRVLVTLDDDFDDGKRTQHE